MRENGGERVRVGAGIDLDARPSPTDMLSPAISPGTALGSLSTSSAESSRFLKGGVVAADVLADAVAFDEKLGPDKNP